MSIAREERLRVMREARVWGAAQTSPLFAVCAYTDWKGLAAESAWEFVEQEFAAACALRGVDADTERRDVCVGLDWYRWQCAKGGTA